MTGKTASESYFSRSLILHYGVTIFAVAVGIVLTYCGNNQVSQGVALDISRTLLAFNGTLFALPLGFATFYLTVIETKRQSASMQLNSTPIDYGKMDVKAILRADGQFKSDDEIRDDVVRQAAEQNPNYPFLVVLIKSYRSMMQSFSRLLVVISITFGILLFITYLLYAETSGFAVGTSLPFWPFSYLYAIVVVSPFVTVLDVVFLVTVLSRNVAGRPYKDEFQEINKRVKEQAKKQGIV